MRRVAVLAVSVLIGLPATTIAAPGAARLVSGVLEWPAAVTTEPFVVIRGDDGVLYYASVPTVTRGGLKAGLRVAMLGFEGRQPHELAAVGIGVGDTAEAALSHLQSGRAAAATSAAPPAPSPAAAPAPAAVTPSSPQPAPPVSAPAAPSAMAVPVPAAPVAPAVAVPASSAPAAATPPAPAGPPPPPPVAAAALSASIAGPASEPVTKPLAGPVADERRWTEVSGVVEHVIGRTLVLRAPEGRITVDVSSLSPNLPHMAAPGALVKVYGFPVELRFKAMGFLTR